jgi:nucleoside-diphosphate-sugar epimerase
MNRVKVFVTGATGLVGLQLTRHLLERDYHVIGCVRSTSKIDELTKLADNYKGRMALTVADICEKDRLAAAMKDVDVVVHAAAFVEPTGSKTEIDAVNIGGTSATLRAAIAAGVKQFVHISSLSVITGEQDRFNVSEDEPPKYCREHYANSKIDAEKLVMKESALGNIAVTSLRPGFIYGPNERTWMPRLVKALKSGRAMLVGKGDKETNVIYVENLCRAIELSLLNSTAFGQIYNLTDGQLITKRKLFDTICDELGLPRVKLYIPKLAARAICEFATFASPLAPPSLKITLSRYSRAAYRLVAVNQGFDISKAEQQLNYLDRIPFQEGMSKTLLQWRS